MMKTVACALAISTVSADPYPDAHSRPARCGFGLSVSGVGGRLDGDFFLDTNSGLYVGERRGVVSISTGEHVDKLFMVFSHKGDGANTSTGCWAFGCTALGIERADKKWAIVSNDGEQARVLAVCETGCPHIVDNCTDLNPDIMCGRWPKSPQAYSTFQTWINYDNHRGPTKAIGKTMVGVSASCCEPEDKYCSSLCTEAVCSVLNGKCPNYNQTTDQEYTDIQSSCCVDVVSGRANATSSCMCKAPVCKVPTEQHQIV